MDPFQGDANLIAVPETLHLRTGSNVIFRVDLYDNMAKRIIRGVNPDLNIQNVGVGRPYGDYKGTIQKVALPEPLTGPTAVGYVEQPTFGGIGWRILGDGTPGLFTLTVPWTYKREPRLLKVPLAVSRGTVAQRGMPTAARVALIGGAVAVTGLGVYLAMKD